MKGLHKMEGAGKELLLFYVICDESGSMGDNGGIDQINAALPELYEAIASDPLVVDKSRMALITFSDEARLILPLSKVNTLTEIPGVKAGGSTSYGAALRLAKRTIDSDVKALTGTGYRVLRPCIFFISDGDPTDSWEAARQELIDGTNAPTIITFGVGDAGAKPTHLARLATLKCFAGRDRSRAGTALATVMSSIGNTIIASTTRKKSQDDTILITDDIEGFDSVPLSERR